MNTIQLSFDTPKLCECGCGLPAPIAKHNHKARGHVKGEPVRFIYGHYRNSPLEQRFLSKVEKTDSCWLWRGNTVAGYGAMHIKGKSVYAHRYSHELYIGPIPKGLQVDHLCFVPTCVNPAHLEAVPPKINAMRRSAHNKGRKRQTLLIDNSLAS